MKRFLLSIILFAPAIVISGPAMARVDISVNISLPSPIVFAAPPAVVVLPETDNVYVAPDVNVDLFFWNGWWWRPWEGRWYRSRYYNRGWAYYNRVPCFYYDVDPRWRDHYRDHNWYGHQWNYERIPHGQLQHNWRNWREDRHWQRQRTWGVQAYQPRPHHEMQEARRQREREYQQRPEVRRHQEQMQEQRRHPDQRPQAQPQRQPYVQQPQRQAQAQPPRYQQTQQQQPQARGQQQDVESQHKRSHGRSERGDDEHRR